MYPRLIMWKASLRTGTRIVLSSLLGLASAGCNSESPASLFSQSANAVPTAPSPTPDAPPQEQSPAGRDPYQQAIDTATGAMTVSQTALSRRDWSLVATCWAKAIQLLKTVPSSSSHYAAAQKKLPQYQYNLYDAALRAAPPPAPPARGDTNPPFFSAPIKERILGVPVIEVTFNGQRKFKMFFDTGASSTLISMPAAQALGLEFQGSAKMGIANGTVEEFPVAFVNSMEIDGRLKRKVRVTVAPPAVRIGLLGQDFFQGYDVTLRDTAIEFRRR